MIRAKAAVDSVPGCKNKVSCADILALATRDVIVLVSITPPFVIHYSHDGWFVFLFFFLGGRGVGGCLDEPRRAIDYNLRQLWFAKNEMPFHLKLANSLISLESHPIRLTILKGFLWVDYSSKRLVTCEIH